MQDKTKLGTGLFDVDDIQGIKLKIAQILETLETEFGNLNQPEADSVEVAAKKDARLLELVDLHEALTPGERMCLLWELRKRALATLEALLQSDMDVSIYGARSVHVGPPGYSEEVDLGFEDNDCLRRQIDRFLAAFNLELSDSAPMASVRLKDGSRVEIVIPPMAVDGPAVTIKRFQQRARSLDELMDETPRIKVIGDQTFKLATARMMSENMVNVLKACVKGRVNIIVSGPRDAGKTTILNALCQHLNPREQPCAIEHYPELCLPLDRLVRLQPSSPDGRGDCEIDQRLLVRKALSMNPSRLLLGDCTGGEAYDLLTRSSTSETAWMMTMEANSPDDCLMRLEEQMTRGQSNLSSLMARHFIAQAKPVIVQVRRIEDGTRRVTEIAEVQGLNDGKPKSPWLMERLNLEQVKENDILIAKLFHIERAGRDSLGFFKTKFVANDRIPSFVEKLEQEGVAFKMEWIKKQETLESSAL